MNIVVKRTLAVVGINLIAATLSAVLSAFIGGAFACLIMWRNVFVDTETLFGLMRFQFVAIFLWGTYRDIKRGEYYVD